MDILQPLKKVFRSRSRRVYLDYAAATPVCREVYDAMRPYFRTGFGNASSVHTEGQYAQRAIADARKQIARILAIRREEVTFTAGGTEANNLALVGMVDAAHAAGTPYTEMTVLTTPLEHPSILATLRALESRGITARMVAVTEDGRIDQSALREALSPEVRILSISYVHSEIGVVEDVKRISRLVREYNQKHDAQIRVHLDASQAPLWLSCQMDRLGVDTMTLDAGKCYGPKGVGVLAHRSRTALTSQMFGGSQERGLRAGTENTPLIVGAATAFVRAQQSFTARSSRVQALRDLLFAQIAAQVPEAVVNGSLRYRVANNVNISLPGYDTEYAVVSLDAHGVAASTKSACSGADGSSSAAVEAIAGIERARSTIRFTLGEATTSTDIHRAVSILAEHIALMRTYKGVNK